MCLVFARIEGQCDSITPHVDSSAMFNTSPFVEPAKLADLCFESTCTRVQPHCLLGDGTEFIVLAAG